MIYIDDDIHVDPVGFLDAMNSACCVTDQLRLLSRFATKAYEAGRATGFDQGRAHALKALSVSDLRALLDQAEYEVDTLLDLL